MMREKIPRLRKEMVLNFAVSRALAPTTVEVHAPSVMVVRATRRGRKQWQNLKKKVKEKVILSALLAASRFVELMMTAVVS